MSISEKIYALRTKSGVTQEVFAEKLAVSRQSVQKWESGVSLPTIDKLITMATIFNVSIDYLCDRADSAVRANVSTDIFAVHFFRSREFVVMPRCGNREKRSVVVKRENRCTLNRNRRRNVGQHIRKRINERLSSKYSEESLFYVYEKITHLSTYDCDIIFL